MDKKITIRDIAAHCGVSLATVSNVLNCKGSVSEKNRTAVMEAVKTLGYVPSLAARHMRTGRPFDEMGNNYIEIILPDNSYMSLFHMELIRTIIAEAFSYGYQIVTSIAYSDIHTVRADGIILATELDINFDVPVVTADFFSDDHKVPGVCFDYAAGIKEAVGKAFLLGYRKPVLFMEKPDTGKDVFYSIYYKGYAEALMENGMEPAASLYGKNGVTAMDGYSFTTDLCTSNRDFDLILCTDDVAFGVYRALEEQGRQVAEDVGIIGCDGVPLSSFFSPGLSTISTDLKRMAAEVLPRLLALIKEKDGPYPQKQLLPVIFEDRGSLAK